MTPPPVSIDELLQRARARLDRVSPQETYARLNAGELVVDARTEGQRARDGDIPGAVVVNRTVLEWRLDPTCPFRMDGCGELDDPVIVVCDQGYSSSLAAASLKDLGRTRATDLIGGFQAWREAGLPVDRPLALGHWDKVYRDKADEQTSWHQEQPHDALDALDSLGAASDASVIDVGGGTARLVDALLERGHRNVCVLDVAGAALARTRERLGPRARHVELQVADVTAWQPRRQFDVWHDRAVFHFLTTLEDRASYFEAMSESLAPGGLAVVATFAHDGPETCSGLPVARYTPDELTAHLTRGLGPGAEVVLDRRVEHVTPWHAVQPFTLVAVRRGSPALRR